MNTKIIKSTLPLAFLLLVTMIGLAVAEGKAPFSNETETATVEQVVKPTAQKSSTAAASGEEINWQVISSGGIMGAASANYMMDGTAGQATAGYGYSTNYGLGGGFWMVFGPPETSCCVGRVGDANGIGGDEPTIGDVSTMIDALFISGDPNVIACLAEADINQSGGVDPQPSDITIGDISTLIDYLFITGPSLGLPDCL